MAGPAPRTRHELEAGLNERAAKDAAFRRALAEDPKGTLRRELAVTVPEGIRLTVLEETAGNRYLVLPPRPLGGDRELSDEDLDGVAGGTGMSTDWFGACY
jgi:hypothetical protein